MAEKGEIKLQINTNFTKDQVGVNDIFEVYGLDDFLIDMENLVGRNYILREKLLWSKAC